jgi:CHAT domain-containing protein
MIHTRRVAAGTVGLVVALAGACTRKPAEPTGNPLRAEPAALALPSDPIGLAAALAVPAESLRAAGEERYGRQAFDSARAIWSVELTRARAAGDSVAEARVRMWLGLAAWRLGDYPAARREGEASLALKRRIGLDAELSRSFNGLGLLAWNEGRHRAALTLFDSALVAARRHGDRAMIARATGNIPLVQVELGEFDAARQGFLAAVEAGRALGDDKIQGNSLANLGMLAVRLGDPRTALHFLTEARQHYATFGDALGEANALGQLATAWSGLGELQRAIAAADSDLALARAHGLQQEVAAVLEVLADLLVQGGDLRPALHRLGEADSIDAALGLAVERGNNLRRQSAILLELGEAQAAVARSEAALAAHDRVEAHAEVVHDRLQLAVALSRAGSLVRARAQVDSALAEGQRLGSPLELRDAAAVAAHLALESGDARGALHHLPARVATETSLDWRLADLRGQALLAMGRINEARNEGEAAIKALERERGSLGMGPLRSAYIASRAGPFSHLVAIHLARGDTTTAFRVAASMQGRGLAERLGGMAEASGHIAEVAEGERILLRAAVLEQKLDSLGADRESAERRAGLDRQLASARAAYEEHLASRAPTSGGRWLGLVGVSLGQVQSLLGDDEALLTFLAGPERLDLFVVWRTGVLHRGVPIGERDLALRVRVARELLAAAHRGGEVAPPLAELYDLLLAPAVAAGALDGASRLLIVPGGPLGALPFAALWNRRTGRFLVQDRVVTYLPTVAALGERSVAEPKPEGRLTIFAPLPDSLPGTEREARAVARLVPGAELRLGLASDEAGFRHALEAGRPIHLASHGSSNIQNPMFSRIFVGRPGSGLPENDGRLEVHEILLLATTSSLVFLSGCETGVGTAGQSAFESGSEAGSLAQAFLVAGARNVVATLWRVPDAGAADLAERFYRHLATGRSPSDALALAQRDGLVASPGYTWAAYAVFGVGTTERKAGYRLER